MKHFIFFNISLSFINLRYLKSIVLVILNLLLYILKKKMKFFFQLKYMIRDEKKVLLEKIPISYGLDNNNYYPTLVSITSILENANNFTFYYFYLMVSKNQKKFSLRNKRKFKKIEKYYKRCKITIIEINDYLFKFARVSIKHPISSYYRLLLADLFPYLKRIIYLDGDTLVLTDLSEMININMNNNIVMGFIDDKYYLTKKFGIISYKYITAGVLLFNLEKMRKEKITKKFFRFMQKNKKLLTQKDQTIINIVLNKRIGFLPPKFGIWDFSNKKNLIFHNHYKGKIRKKGYKDNEIIKAYEHPSIIHFVLKKPYKNKNYLLNNKFIKIWLNYAKKTKEFKAFLKYYNISCNI